MTAKKITRVPATAHRTNKTRKHKAPKSEAASTETAISTEPVTAEATESETHPAPEPVATVTAMPVPVEAAVADQAEEGTQGEAASPPTAPTTRLSALEAALRVLAESGQALSCPELIAAMAAKDYWSSPTGRTPASTLYACFLREMKTKGDTARIIKTTRGKFAFRPVV